MAGIVKKVSRRFGPKLNEKEIKCVVIGDNGIGKTRLICSYVYNQPCIAIESLNSPTHTPTIFANHNVDKNTAEFQLLHRYGRRNVKLLIWDTFGDHQKDREYSYNDADIVFVCFNIGSLQSLESVASHWIYELKKYCKHIPVVLVGLQADRRHNDPIKYYNHERKIRSLREYLQCPTRTSTRRSRRAKRSKCIDVDIARKVASDIGALLYFETSVATRFGVRELFSAAVQLGMLKKSQRTENAFQNRKVEMLQPPFLNEKTKEPCIYVKHQTDFSFRSLFKELTDKPSTLTDIEFELDDGIFYAHSLVLGLSVPTLKILFQNISTLYSDATKKHQGPISLDFPGFDQCSVSFENQKPRFHFKIHGQRNVFKSILEFYYTGDVTDLEESENILEMSNILNFTEVVRYLSDDEDCSRLLLSAYIQCMGQHYTENYIFSDITFLVGQDLVEVPAHKVILSQRSDVFSAMLLNGDFVESSSSKVDFRDTNLESFRSVLEYLYTGECKEISDLHGTLQLANFLCLRHLVMICEDRIAKYITQMKSEEKNEVYEYVIGSYILGEYHNAPQLSAWCLHFMSTNYNDLCRHQKKEMKNLLDDETLKLLEDQRWPPVWYLKEQDYYERTVQRMLTEQNEKRERKKRKRICSGCF